MAKPPPQFSAHFYCGQMVRRIKMPLGMEVGLNPGHFVLDGDPAPPPRGGGRAPNFRPMSIGPNGCMDQDATCYGGRPWPRRHCVRWGPSSTLPKKGVEFPPLFVAHVYCDLTAGWIKIHTWGGGGPWSRPPCARWGSSSPPQKEG